MLDIGVGHNPFGDCLSQELPNMYLQRLIVIILRNMTLRWEWKPAHLFWRQQTDKQANGKVRCIS